ncbi:MAG: signal peptidase II [Alphaproteobacteria bacterium]|nr:signal peptidase II [Alphaproteobacteria bacterium]
MLRYGLSLAAAVLVLDQASKWALVELWTPPPGGLAVLPFFNLVLVWNRGVSFGMFSGGMIGPYIFAGFAFVVAIGLAVWLRRAENALIATALGLVMGGAIGNGIDRLRWGAVADFLDFHAFGWHFWAFNVADAAISVGVAGLLLDSLFQRPEENK